MKVLFNILLSVFPLISYADTLDFWSIELNDSVLAKFNAASYITGDLTVTIKDFDEEDTLIVRYGNDSPCFSCNYYFAIKNSEGEKLHAVQKTELNLYEPIRFPMSLLLHQQGVLDLKEPSLFEIFMYVADNKISFKTLAYIYLLEK